MRVLLRAFLLHAPLLYSLGIHYGNLFALISKCVCG